MAQTQKELTAKKAVLVKRLSKLRKIFQRYGLRTTAREIGQVIDRLKRIKVAKPSAKGAKPKAIEAVPARAKAGKRKEMSAQKFLGKLFKKHWKTFFNANKAAYKDFLSYEKVKDSPLVRKQWTAAMLCYRMSRYGGTLGVNFKYTYQRKNIKATGVKSSIRNEKQIKGKQFSVLFKDILRGSKYSDPKSNSSYVTFGDCDELALLMAQMIKTISEENKLGMDSMVYRVDQPHANTAFKIGGKRFVLDPSYGTVDNPHRLDRKYNEIIALKKSEIKNPKSAAQKRDAIKTLRAIRTSIIRIKKSQRPIPIYDDKYQRESAPKIEGILQRSDMPKITHDQQGYVENAAKKASKTIALEQSVLEREIQRRKWGYKPEDSIYVTIKDDFLPSALKLPNGRKNAIKVLTDFVAASTKRPPGEKKFFFEKNRIALENALKNKTDAEKVRTLRRLALRVGKGRYLALNDVLKASRA